MSNIIDMIFSKVMMGIIFLCIVISFCTYSLYILYYPVTYTHNYIILDNVVLGYKGTCDMYNNKPNTMCMFNIKRSKLQIELPQKMERYNTNITIGVKMSKLRHVVYVKYSTRNVMKPVEYVDIMSINKFDDLYYTYCNKLNVQYCKSE